MSKSEPLPKDPAAAGTESLLIEIANCNSIERAAVSIRRGSLNIKYGPNGIGKSTIARALELNAEDGQGLEDLRPFKHRDDETVSPSVVGADEIRRVLVFNDDYVSQFVFRPDEVLKDSFEIFINTPEYQEGLGRIEAILESLRQVFANNEPLDTLIASFAELRDAFAVTKAGGIARTSRGFKALGVGGKLSEVPEQLRGYESFLKSDDPAGWVSWQAKGKPFLDFSSNCPFCAVPEFDKETAQQSPRSTSPRPSRT